MPTLNWIGKDKVANLHSEVPFRVLEHQYGYDGASPESNAFTGSGNKIIHGDTSLSRQATPSTAEILINSKGQFVT